MRVQIVTPTEKFFDEEAISVQAPGSEGYFGVLANHAPFLTTLKDGDVTIKLADKSEKIFKVSGGMADVNNNIVRILAESVEAK
jgi:F-type H+-transporting ATPase subunit epsilon